MLRKALLLALLALAVALPASAGAASRQFSIIQDDGAFLGKDGRDPERAMAEAKLLGVDVVRVFVNWYAVSPGAKSRKRPEGFDVGDPSSPGYDWSAYDGLVDRARRYGIKLLMTLAPAIPYWASDEPRRCPHRIGGYSFFGFSCFWKPNPELFGQFTKAVALRYGANGPPETGGQVRLWSLWNEPNLEHYLYPQLQRQGGVLVDVAARYYRNLWLQGYKAIAKYDPARRNAVLFGETAAISSPLDTLYAALCLDEQGRPFRGRQRALQGCSRPQRLPIGGLAVHPYNKDGVGTVFTRTHTLDSHPPAYLPRLHRLLDRAARYGRIPGGRGIYITEFGFQTRPPDGPPALSLGRHAQAINEAERLFFADPRVKSFAQYELYDVPNRAEFNTGLRLRRGKAKPAWAAFRMPIVVTRLTNDLVEVWGQARPANGRVTVRVSSIGAGGAAAQVAAPRTNPAGYFRIRLRRPGAARLAYQVRWTDPADGTVLKSRVARAGAPIHYLPDPKPRH